MFIFIAKPEGNVSEVKIFEDKREAFDLFNKYELDKYVEDAELFEDETILCSKYRVDNKTYENWYPLGEDYFL